MPSNAFKTISFLFEKDQPKNLSYSKSCFQKSHSDFWFCFVLICIFFFLVLGRVYRAVDNTTSIMEIGLKT